MTANLPLTSVRVDPTAVPATSLNRYVRYEFGDRDATWFVTIARSAERPRRTYRANGDRLLLRAARAIATFLF